MMESIRSSETSVPTRAPRRHIPEDDILYDMELRIFPVLLKRFGVEREICEQELGRTWKQVMETCLSTTSACTEINRYELHFGHGAPTSQKVCRRAMFVMK
jgi:hypothetical protein